MLWLYIPDAGTHSLVVIIFATMSSVAALAAAAGAFVSNPYSWGRRLLALIGGAAFGLLAVSLPQMSKDGSNGGTDIASLAIFFGFSLPLLMFALWGSIWGRLGRHDIQQSNASTSDRLLLLIRIVTSFVVVILYLAFSVSILSKHFGLLR